MSAIKFTSSRYAAQRSAASLKIERLTDTLAKLIANETDLVLLDIIQDDLSSNLHDDNLHILALEIWIATLHNVPTERVSVKRIPTYMRYSNNGDDMRPRSRWEANGLRIARAAQAGRSAV